MEPSYWLTRGPYHTIRTSRTRYEPLPFCAKTNRMVKTILKLKKLPKKSKNPPCRYQRYRKISWTDSNRLMKGPRNVLFCDLNVKKNPKYFFDIYKCQIFSFKSSAYMIQLMDHFPLTTILISTTRQNSIIAWKSITKWVIFQSFVAKCCKMRII